MLQAANERQRISKSRGSGPGRRRASRRVAFRCFRGAAAWESSADAGIGNLQILVLELSEARLRRHSLLQCSDHTQRAPSLLRHGFDGYFSGRSTGLATQLLQSRAHTIIPAAPIPAATATQESALLHTCRPYFGPTSTFFQCCSLPPCCCQG